MKKIIITNISMLILILGCKMDVHKKEVGLDTNQNDEKLREEGKEIISETFIALSGKLQKAMETGGVEYALTYCNESALGLTDSLAKAHNVDIKRTSLKYRNSGNKPNAEEVAMLTRFQEKLDRSEMILPEVVDGEKYAVFYAPIILQDMCLKCHGSKTEMVHYDVIQSFYPDDMAFDYRQGDLRGMWSVTFKKKI
jgi:hypothetical protein